MKQCSFSVCVSHVFCPENLRQAAETHLSFCASPPIPPNVLPKIWSLVYLYKKNYLKSWRDWYISHTLASSPTTPFFSTSSRVQNKDRFKCHCLLLIEWRVEFFFYWSWYLGALYPGIKPEVLIQLMLLSIFCFAFAARTWPRRMSSSRSTCMRSTTTWPVLLELSIRKTIKK